MYSLLQRYIYICFVSASLTFSLKKQKDLYSTFVSNLAVVSFQMLYIERASIFYSIQSFKESQQSKREQRGIREDVRALVQFCLSLSIIPMGWPHLFVFLNYITEQTFDDSHLIVFLLSFPFMPACHLASLKWTNFIFGYPGMLT